MSIVISSFIWYPSGYPGPAYDLRDVYAWGDGPTPGTVRVRFSELGTSATVVFDAAAFEAAMATASTLAPPVNVVAPVVSGVPYTGWTLSVTSGWTGVPGPVITYQWQTFNGITWDDIIGATNNTYVVEVATEGLPTRVEVTATNTEGIVAAVSNTVEAWVPLDLAPDGIWDPADTTTVTLVVDRISNVSNKGTAGVKNMSQGAGAEQPLYGVVDGKRTIECDTSGHSMSWASFGVPQTTGFTLLLATAPPYGYTSPVSGRIQFGQNGSFDRFCFVREAGSQNTILQRPAGFSSGTLDLPQAQTGVTSETHTKPAGGSNVNQCNSYQNGSSSQNYTSTGITFGSDTGNQLNAVSANGNRGTCTYLYVGFLTREINSTERDKWEGFVAWRYNDTSNLPPGHPYKNTYPTP